MIMIFIKYLRDLFLCTLCWCLCATLAAQTSKIDSLEQVLASNLKAKAEKAELLVDLSHAYLYVDTAKCRACAIEALQLAQNSGSKLAEARAYDALGNYYGICHIPYQAHTYHIKAEKLFLELNNHEQLYIHYRFLMSFFYDFDDYENAEAYANKVLIMATERKDWNSLLTAQYVFGASRFRDDYGQEALDYFLNLYRRSVHIDDSLHTTQFITTTLAGRCARSYMRGLKRPEDALPYLHQVRTSYLKNDLKTLLTYIYNELAEAHALMHNVDSAEYYIHKAMDSPQTIDRLGPVYLTRSMIDSLKGDYLNALANFQKYYHIKDNLSNVEKTTEMARLRVWYEFDQKDLENKLLQQENQTQRKLTLILAVTLVIILMLLTLAVFFYIKMTEKNRQMKELHTVKDKLFSVVAHDLRSPVSSLVSLLRLINIDKLDPKEQSQLFKDISNRVDNTYHLLDNLLRWSKSQMQGIVPAPVYFDVQKESRSLTDSLQTIAIHKNIILENHIEQQQVYADRDMFAVVIRNLTTNAIKYTPINGTVILEAKLSNNDMLIVSVKDTGTGISQEVQNTLFKLYETRSQHGTNNESGTGLGLAMCADFVKANGGRIWFTSTQGEGSTFFFSIPLKGN